jgi:glycosyltransferase involved in cell wall biosynthesis
MTLPGVSVIIPCYNQTDTLRRAVESALTAGADEVVMVIEAGSDDATILAAAQYVDNRNVRRIFIEGDAPAGVCYTRNLGISLARYDWILPLDADDEFLPRMVAWVLEQAQPGTAIYGDYAVGNTAMHNADPGMIYRKSVCHATVLFSKADWQRVGGYKPEFNVGAEDYDFVLSLHEAGVRLVHVDAPIYRKTINPDGRGAKCLNRRSLIVSLLKEYHPRLEISP